MHLTFYLRIFEENIFFRNLLQMFVLIICTYIFIYQLNSQPQHHLFSYEKYHIIFLFDSPIYFFLEECNLCAGKIIVLVF